MRLMVMNQRDRRWYLEDQHIGGCDAIHDLERQGKLDLLLV